MAQLRAPSDEQRQELALHGVVAGGNESSNKKARAGLCGVLRERKVVELARAKRRLVEVPYTATLVHTANALLATRVSGVAVAAPPGHWIGAGGSMILESDPATGVVRKHYIGMVNMLDILAHIAEASDDAEADGEAVDLDRRMAVPVSSVIGHSLEGLTLWTLHPTTSVLDCMETFSKGVHRSLVPLESSADNVVAVELVESAPGYRMLTQMDVVRFLRAHGAELRGVLSRTVRELGAVNDTVFAVAGGTKVIDAIRAMRAASLTAVPVVDAAAVGSGTETTLQYGNGQRAIETFSATDLRNCPVARLQPWLGISVTEFKRKVAEYRGSNRPVVPGADATDTSTPADTPAAAAVATDDEQSGQQQESAALVTCSPDSTLGEAIEAAASRHVHRLWVVDEEGLLRGVVSLTDILRAVREAALGEDRELHSIVS
ncbi:SNF1-related protein kinase regulatory subunit gamma-like PV42a [Miscanthus floridulus]|uniref:SNF1-related protein kinase regulatory subunit gamma-like PV42a n=1 Tax=Miscanthus floridulus TaxID=154761 RepID=UPI00345AE29B